MSQRSMIWPRTMTWTSTSLVRMPCASLTKTAICCHLKIRTETGSGSSQASWSVFLRNWAIHSGLLYIYYIYIYIFAAGLRQLICSHNLGWWFQSINVFTRRKTTKQRGSRRAGSSVENLAFQQLHLIVYLRWEHGCMPANFMNAPVIDQVFGS